MGRFMLAVIAGMLVVALSPMAFADTLKRSPFSDWRDGDLIFHNSWRSQQTLAVAWATGSLYTHMGIVKLTRKGPVVVEAIGPVLETPLKTFIARGHDSYAVYRVKGLSPKKASEVLAEAKKYYGRRYDLFFRMDDERIYCSELPFKAFAAVGIPIGSPQTFSQLHIHNPAVRSLFNKRWREHPDCGKLKTADQCWNVMLKQEIISPARLTEDPRVERVYAR